MPTEIAKGDISRNRRVTQSDFDQLAETVIEEWNRRKRERSDLEKQWKEVDRQLRMEPDQKAKMTADGKIDPEKRWMAEAELPWQAQTHEVLVADARRMMFPTNGGWFAPHTALTDDYLDEVNFSSLVMGDKNEVPSELDQVDADGLVEGFVRGFEKQYDFRGNIDKINGEAFGYGTGVGRGRLVEKPVFIDTAKGVQKKTQKIPMLVPRSIKNTYLDDRLSNVTASGFFSGPAVIYQETWSYDDLVMAANKGSKDPDKEDGGWMPKGVSRLEPPKNRQIVMLEYEGDIVIPRKTVKSLYIPNAIITVAIGGKEHDKATKAIVRFRFRKTPYSSYIAFPYHHEQLDTPYAVGPLLKGAPIQRAAAFLLNRGADGAMLQMAPPVGWNKDDYGFQQTGGPRMEPFAKWELVDPNAVRVFREVGGDPAALFNVFLSLQSMYADVVGVNAPRLGAQTVSHTTAFAKDAELTRGTIRTVDYVRATGSNAMVQWLDMAYRMGREAVSGPIQMYLDKWQGFVEIEKSQLPETVEFEWLGSAGPADDATKMQQRTQSAMMALQIDAQRVQLGQEPVVNTTEMIKSILRDGGWIDLDVITRLEADASGDTPAPGVSQSPGGAGTPTGPALQALLDQ